MSCAHEYIWPDSTCVECGEITTGDGSHIMVTLRQSRIPRNRWIDLFGRREIEESGFRVLPCACLDDQACKGWQVVFPGQQPHLPVEGPFYRQLARQRQLESSVAESSRALKEAAGNDKTALGLTPDKVKRSAAYRTALQGYQVAFARLGLFNRNFTKLFARELQMMRDAKRMAQ